MDYGKLESELKNVIEAPLAELHVLSRDYSLEDMPRIYAVVIENYLSGDFEKLKAAQDQFFKINQSKLPPVENQIFKDLVQLINLRVLLRSKKLKLSDIKKFQFQFKTEILEAEKQFLLGRCYEHFNNDQGNIECSLKAANLFKKNNINKKALRSFYNSIAAESRLSPYKSFISEYQSVINCAEKIQDYSFAGMAYCMLAREYQIINLNDKALELINLGLDLLKQETGSIHYFNSLLQKADILRELSQLEESRKTLLETKLASFPEIIAARHLLECLTDSSKTWDKKFESDLMPTWKERLQILQEKFQASIPEDFNDKHFTFLELKLVKILWTGPLNRWEIINQIYSDTENSEILVNRFKNLIARVKKKIPNSIECKGGQYYLKNKTQLEL